MFPHIQFYANAYVLADPDSSPQQGADSRFRMNDLTVPYCTAAVELDDPFMNHKKTGINMYVNRKVSRQLPLTLRK